MSTTMAQPQQPQAVQQGPVPIANYLPEPKTVAATGLNSGLISDLVLKTLYFTSYLSGAEIADSLRLAFYGVIDQMLINLKREELAEVSGTAGLGEAGYKWLLTRKGMDRCAAVLRRSSYVGPAPVPLNKYIEMVLIQAQRKPRIDRQLVQASLQGMAVSVEMQDRVGAAVNAGKSLFLFGAPGNGKTSLAERIGKMLGGNIAVPHAIEADGQVIQFFDPHLHRPAQHLRSGQLDDGQLSGNEIRRSEFADSRWVQVSRPVVVVGGELSMDNLDLIYNAAGGLYEAPFQLKANNGVFLIDDFGRQQMSPQVLLNRWIVPLEKSIDFLTLHTGKKLQLPFELFLVLSTNLDPSDLVDEAFSRRIQNKLLMPGPTLEQFRSILIAQCQAQAVAYDESGFLYLYREHYEKSGRPMRGCHPRDLLRQLVGLAKYQNLKPALVPQLIDQAAQTYFVV